MLKKKWYVWLTQCWIIWRFPKYHHNNIFYQNCEISHNIGWWYLEPSSIVVYILTCGVQLHKPSRSSILPATKSPLLGCDKISLLSSVHTQLCHIAGHSRDREWLSSLPNWSSSVYTSTLSSNIFLAIDHILT